MLGNQMRGFQQDAIYASDDVHLALVTISRGGGEVFHVALWRGGAEDITSRGIS